ncbi:broad-complex core protein isoforms 1/2/3/4/5 isoform X4 [Polistes fuscatus]|uniref:broad-complex core protein isoforms 1/2/3/4/5 isoform X4 n=1 Tax=Polistes fuscatus TaxID=30207 RepID=UPI001CA96F29|nr:broad-complex core protein isoforms 1/2/3/4/5 isoform X4 [Polistes fuscatus]
MRIDCELMCSFFNIYTCMCVFYSGGMAGQHYCLRWNNYQSNMTSVFHQLLQNEAFVDVTLACNEASLKAHKVVLSACSSYFQKLLLSNPCKHPTIIMPQDVCFSDLKFIIEFVYRGEIDVSQAELQSLLKTADQLKIKGLCEVPESKDGPPSVSLSSPPREPGSQRFNFTRLKRPYPRYKRTRTSFEPRATDSRHYDRYKEEEDSDSYHRKNKENRRDWQVEDEECTEVAAAAAVVLESCQRNSNNSTNNANGTNNNNNNEIQNCDTVKIKFETLHTMDSSDTIDIDSHMSDRASVSSKNAADSDNMMMITPELLGLMPSGSSIHSDSGENNSRGHSGQSSSHHHGNKSWTQEDMDAALEALRNHDMSLTKASAAFGIPSTTLWQRAHRLGIDTPKKDGPTKSWSDESLNNALEALRTGTISANKASKAFGIPSSTLYKIARREGIRLAAPFNASPTTWTPADLDRALEAIRSGQTSVQRASTEFGIPTGTLYGRCKREGIELSRSNPTPWSEDAMTEALEAVRLGHMSINQAAIHYNLPYSSLYGRFKRGKYEEPVVGDLSQDGTNSHFHQSPTQNHSSTIPDQMSYQGS